MFVWVCVLFLALATLAKGACPPCQQDGCPKGAQECPLGLVRDVCECCQKGVCGKTEGDDCYVESLDDDYKKYGLCAKNLECIVRDDLKDRDNPEAICKCVDQRMVCGSDNYTYDSNCQLELHNAKHKKSIQVQSWGPCKTAPWIITKPHDVKGTLQTQTTLSCEVKGYPTPTVNWMHISKNGDLRTLPSDDRFVGIQSRGGPEAFMVTSWVQLVALRPSDLGTYICEAVNAEGRAEASAKVELLEYR